MVRQIPPGGRRGGPRSAIIPAMTYRSISSVSLSLLALGILLGCNPSLPEPPPPPAPEQPLSKEDTASIVIGALKDRNFERLAAFAHPELGTKFTPTTFVQDDHIVLTQNELRQAGSDQKKRTWGNEDGSGLPIEKTIWEYFDRYVADQDFAAAPEVNWNRPFDRGTATDNAREYYGEDAQIVEYFFPGFDPQYEGMDWKGLRLVLLPVGEKWYLAGVIHDEWGP